MAAPSTEPAPVAPAGAQAIGRAIAVLQALIGGEHGVSELAGRTGLRLSTTHRILRALLTEGLVEQDVHSDRYRLGPAAIVLGQAAGVQRGFEHVERALRSLVDATGAAATFSVRRNAGAVVLAVAPGGSEPGPRPGDVEPYHAGASGKALLAWSGESSAEAVAGLDALTLITERTITDPARLTAELDRAVARGWAVDDGETDTGRRAVAAPVLDQQGFARAAVAVGDGSGRLGDRATMRAGAMLVEVATGLAGLLPLDRF